MVKIDPYNSKETYERWKENSKLGIKGINEFNSNLILRYLNDMETGQNIGNGSGKGSRSPIRLMTLKNRIIFCVKKLQELHNVDKITDAKEENLHALFTDMRNGKLTKEDGGTYKSVSDYVKVFKAFWHWHQKVSRKNKIAIDDITIDLDSKAEKGEWVHLTEEQIETLCDNAKFEYRVLMKFMLDSGIRVTELKNIKVSDFSEDFNKLDIRQETSKTFGRNINLVLCCDLIRDYVRINLLKPEDYLFKAHPNQINRYLKNLASRFLGDGVSKGKKKYSELTMYDFRHNSACYFVQKYKKEADMKYRFGWKGSDKIYYYTDFIGMRDSMTKDDLISKESRTEIQMLKDKISTMEDQMKKILEVTNQLHLKLMR
jgi:integrase